MSHLFMLIMAASEKIDPGSIGLSSVKDANAALAGGLNAAYAVAGMVFVLVVIFAGHLYVTSSGDAANLKRAKEAIIGSSIGIILIIMAFVITQFVLGRF